MGVFAEFALSAASASQFPNDMLPEIALVGRSNVGKSSMLNCLLQNRKLARTSNTPGRTQTLNFYRVWPEGSPKVEGQKEGGKGARRSSLQGPLLDHARATGAFYFVDMPGYGFARVSESQKRAWRKLIEDYLLNRENLCAVIQVVDLRHPPSKDDITMWDWLRHYQKLRLCLATKADKIPRSKRQAHLRVIARDLGMASVAPPDPAQPMTPDTEPLVLFSAEEGTGREQLWQWVRAVTLAGTVQK